jgi:hypothetical protein
MLRAQSPISASACVILPCAPRHDAFRRRAPAIGVGEQRISRGRRVVRLSEARRPFARSTVTITFATCLVAADSAPSIPFGTAHALAELLHGWRTSLHRAAGRGHPLDVPRMPRAVATSCGISSEVSPRNTGPPRHRGSGGSADCRCRRGSSRRRRARASVNTLDVLSHFASSSRDVDLDLRLAVCAQADAPDAGRPESRKT